MTSLEDFKKITDVVINKLEGGYYHPDMLTDGRVKDPRYSTSGETMFGIDRINGIGLRDRSQVAWDTFWSLIDKADARSKWSWNYLGGDLNAKLKALVAEMMYPNYVYFSNRYISPESQKLIDTEPKLIFNFAYATWNGQGWFRDLAKKLNEVVKGGVRDTTKLTTIIVDERISKNNSLISGSGKKIKGFIFQLKELSKRKIIVIPVVLLLMGGAALLTYLYITSKK